MFCQTPDGRRTFGTSFTVGSNTQSNAAGGNFLLTLNLPSELFCRNLFGFCCPEGEYCIPVLGSGIAKAGAEVDLQWWLRLLVGLGNWKYY